MNLKFKKLLGMLLVFSMLISQISTISLANAFTEATISKDPPKRIIGYFCEWGDKEDKGFYTVDKLPWDKLTHINYAFARVNENFEIDFIDREAAVEREYPGQLSHLPYKGHFNLIQKYKEMYPNVKVLISIGGWAESTGFYEMLDTKESREIFANSCIEFLKQYNLDGIDIDFEYPTATSQAGNPKDFHLAEPRRQVLFDNYTNLMKTLREKLDAQETIDNKDYLLTVAATASSWILGGMQLGQYAEYLDYANLMTYDFHGAWNQYVGHNAALYPDNRDPETKQLGVPVLNIDWAYKYYRGVLPPEKINIGIPYYSRGWKNVRKGNLPGGLYGTGARKGGGADGEFGIWNDPAPEEPAGANPIWHIKNLLNKPENERFFDDICKAPYLWNEEQSVFLSYEDEESLSHKLDYVIDKRLGGIMIWEMSGDFDKAPDGTYVVGDTLTTLAHETLNSAQYPEAPASFELPEAKDFKVEFSGNYDHPNYTYSMKIINNTGEEIPKGWTLEFDLPKTCTLNSAWGAKLSGPVENGEFNRYKITGPGWRGIPDGDSYTLQGMIKLCFAGGPQNIVLNGFSSIHEKNKH